MARPRKIGFIGVGHYHSTWFPSYLSIVNRLGIEIAGIHDPDEALAADRAGRFGGVPYTDYRKMLDETKPDFVIALGRHVAMPPVFRYLVEAGVPFLMEKPWATDQATLRELVALAESRKAWAAAPFPMRHTFWAEKARDLIQSGEAGKVSHILFRMVRPGEKRYIEQGNEWMLNREQAGGGVLINLGCHGFDLARFITGEDTEVVSAVTSHAACGLEVEDYAFVTLRTPSGTIFHNEVGYTYPTEDGNDNERKVSTENMLITGTNTGLHIVAPGRDEVIEQPEGYVSMWNAVVAECIEALARDDAPPVGVQEAYKGLAPVFDAYRIAGY